MSYKSYMSWTTFAYPESSACHMTRSFIIPHHRVGVVIQPRWHVLRKQHQGIWSRKWQEVHIKYAVIWIKFTAYFMCTSCHFKDCIVCCYDLCSTLKKTFSHFKVHPSILWSQSFHSSMILSHNIQFARNVLWLWGTSIHPMSVQGVPWGPKDDFIRCFYFCSSIQKLFNDITRFGQIDHTVKTVSLSFSMHHPLVLNFLHQWTQDE